MLFSLDFLTEKDLPLLLEWHKEHHFLNFPDSIFKPNKFKLSLLQQIQEIDEGAKAVLWIAFNAQNKFGFLWLKLLYDVYKEYNYCDLHYIHVCSEHRGQGYGKELLDKAEEWAKEKGAKEIRLGTGFDNLRAIEVYKKAGYEFKRILMEKKL